MNWLYPGGVPIALGLVAYQSLLTGFIVFVKRRDKTGLYYFIFSFTVFLWALGCSHMFANNLSQDSRESWGFLSQLVAPFITPPWSHFVLRYTESNSRFHKNLVILGYLIGIGIIITLPLNQFVVGFRSFVQLKTYPVPGFIYYIFTAQFAFIYFHSMYVLFNAWRKRTKQDLKKNELFRIIYCRSL